jgi:hypothetical protein
MHPTARKVKLGSEIPNGMVAHSMVAHSISVPHPPGQTRVSCSVLYTCWKAKPGEFVTRTLGPISRFRAAVGTWYLGNG